MYSEPEWSQETSQSGIIEILKDGKVLKTISIATGTKSLTIGRLPENDISLEHQSISRKHAIIQFGPRNTAFICDLDSSHGTFINKKQIPSSQFVKITSGNAVVHFGASSRLFVLHLEETSAKEPISDPKKMKSSQAAVTEFFSAHSISFKSIIFNRSEDIITCTCDFSVYISIDSSEPSQISSSGTSKEEALCNFYEDSFNFLLRLGVIDVSNLNDTSDSEDNSSEDDFYNQVKIAPKTVKSSNEALSEEQVISLRDQFKSEAENILLVINNFKMKISALESEIVDDLDVYVQDLKKVELENDIEKCNIRLIAAEQELLKYEKILSLIGSKDSSELIEKSKPSAVVKKLEEKVEELPLKDHKKVKVTEAILSEEDKEFVDSEAGIVDFEDSTIHEEQVDFNSFKRKYGY